MVYLLQYYRNMKIEFVNIDNPICIFNVNNLKSILKGYKIIKNLKIDDYYYYGYVFKVHLNPFISLNVKFENEDVKNIDVYLNSINLIQKLTLLDVKLSQSLVFKYRKGNFSILTNLEYLGGCIENIGINLAMSENGLKVTIKNYP